LRVLAALAHLDRDDAIMTAYLRGRKAETSDRYRRDNRHRLAVNSTTRAA
jgi:hypothetical protein